MSRRAPAPRTERIAFVWVDGADFVVGWDEERNDQAEYQFGRLPASQVCWVDTVRLDGVWFWASEVLHSDMLDELDAALASLENLREAV